MWASIEAVDDRQLLAVDSGVEHADFERGRSAA
jgi:hypothetical protein